MSEWPKVWEYSHRSTIYQTSSVVKTKSSHFTSALCIHMQRMLGNMAQETGGLPWSSRSLLPHPVNKTASDTAALWRVRRQALAKRFCQIYKIFVSWHRLKTWSEDTMVNTVSLPVLFSAMGYIQFLIINRSHLPWHVINPFNLIIIADDHYT